MKLQYKKLHFEVVNEFDFKNKHFVPALGIRFVFDLEKGSEQIGVYFYLFFVSIYFDFWR